MGLTTDSHGRGHWFDPSIAHQNFQILTKLSLLHFKLYTDYKGKADTLPNNKPQVLERVAVIHLYSYLEPGGFHDTNNPCLFSRCANPLCGLDPANNSHY